MLKLLRLLGGQLDALDPAFRGFWIRDGRLFNDQFPNGLAAADLVVVNYTNSERDALRLQVQKLKAQVVDLEQRPTPDIGGGCLVIPATFLMGEKKHPKTPIFASAANVQKRTPRWRNSPARAGPEFPAPNNPKNPVNDVLQTSLDPLAYVTSGSEHEATVPASASNPHDQRQGQAAAGMQATGPNAHQNGVSVAPEGSRQTCRHGKALGLSASHGCDAPESTDGRASADQAGTVAVPYPLASQNGANRPDSGRSVSPEGQTDGQLSGAIVQKCTGAEYQLCEHVSVRKIGKHCPHVSHGSTVANDMLEFWAEPGRRPCSLGLQAAGARRHGKSRCRIPVGTLLRCAQNCPCCPFNSSWHYR